MSPFNAWLILRGLGVLVLLVVRRPDQVWIVYLVMGEKATPTLMGWKTWLIHNNATVMMLLFLVFGIVVLSKGLGALIGG